jgi:hypothetical protein
MLTVSLSRAELERRPVDGDSAEDARDALAFVQPSEVVQPLDGEHRRGRTPRGCVHSARVVLPTNRDVHFRELGRTVTRVTSMIKSDTAVDQSVACMNFA